MPMNTGISLKNRAEAARKDSMAYGGEEKPGVYLLFWKKRLAYVGRSRDPAKRIQKHRMNGRAFDYALIVPCDSADVDWIERALIASLNPPQNTLGVTQPRDIPPEAPQIINVTYRAPLAAPAPDPHALVGQEEAKATARKRALLSDFIDARARGELRFFARNPAITGRGAHYVIRQLDLDEWMERTLAARMATEDRK